MITLPSRLGLASSLVVAVLLLQGCGGANGEEAAGEADPPSVPVAVTTVQRATLVAAYEGTTTLEAAREAAIVANAVRTVIVG